MTPWFSGIAAAAIMLASVWLLGRRSPILLLGTFAITFGFSWMLVNAVYLDVSGGSVYAIELRRTIGGGTSALSLSLFYAVFAVALLLVFRRSNLKELKGLFDDPPGGDRQFLRLDLYVWAKGVVILLVIALYSEILRGPVPFLSGIDRESFATLQAGPVTTFLYRYELYLFILIGVLYFEDVRAGRPPGRSVVTWSLVALVAAYVLLGHKFSGIIFNLFLFAAPASLVAFRAGGRAPLINARRVAIALSLFGLFLFTVVRFIGQKYVRPGAIGAYLQQRVLVQQGEMWSAAHERVVTWGHLNRCQAFRAVFVEPVTSVGPSTSNTALTYLMYQELGTGAYAVIARGYLYTGASPTILLELFGLPRGYAVMFLGSLLYGLLLYALLQSVLRRELIVSVSIAFVYGMVHTVFVGGNLAELTSKTFWVKCVLMVLVWLAAQEWRRIQASRPVAVQQQ